MELEAHSAVLWLFIGWAEAALKALEAIRENYLDQLKGDQRVVLPATGSRPVKHLLRKWGCKNFVGV